MQVHRALAVALVVSALGLLAGALVAGPLNPPGGPVTGTHKTLTEVEPRIAINATNTPGDSTSVYRIAAPGSYYLVGDVMGQPGKHGISIQADNVTLDLRGYAVRGSVTINSGIVTTGFRTGVVIRDGLVTGWPGSGLAVAIDSGLIENIISHSNSQWGVEASQGFATRIVGCTAYNNGPAAGGYGGIYTSTFGRCERSVSSFNRGVGVQTAAQATVSNCRVTNNREHGIVVLSQCVVADNQSTNNAVDGVSAAIVVNGTNARIERNHCGVSANGIRVTSPLNFIAGNSCAAITGTPWSIVGNNFYGPIIDLRAAVTPGVLGGGAPGVLGSTDPNANYTY